MKILNRVAAAWLILISLLVATGSVAQPAPPPPPPGELLNAWPFENTNWTSLSHQAPLAFTNLTLYPDWAGNGLWLDTSNAAFLNYAVVSTEGKTNLSLTNGTLAVWFSPDWNTSDGIGNWGTLLEVGTWNMTLTNATGAWGLYFSPDGANLYFSAQTNGNWTNYLGAPINWYAGDWHQITVTYSLTNTALYLEGAFVTNGPGISVWPSASVISNGFTVGSDGFDTAMLQSRGMFNDLEAYNYTLDAETISNNYADDAQIVFPLPSNGGGFFGDTDPSPPGGFGTGTNGGSGSFGTYNIPIYGSNDFWLENVAFGTNANSSTSNYLSLILHATVADTLYEIQSVTNLQEYNTWTSEGFIYGSELTNWTPFFVADNGRPDLFLRIRSWQDSTGTGIPDWWWLTYFGQITNVNAYATNAGDGLNNFHKFQLGLNPLTYFNSNAPPGFFGSLVGSNVVLEWQSAPGPVTNYAVQRGVVNTNTGNYVYSQIALLSSNATYFVDTGAISNTISQSNIYLMEAVYPGGSISGTNTWQVLASIYNDSYYGPLPPTPNSVNGCLNSTGTNVLMTWTAANGPAVGYTVVLGYFTNAFGTETLVPVATVASNVFSYTIVGPFSNPTNPPAAYYMEANYDAGALSPIAGNPYSFDQLAVGSYFGTNGPANVFGYTDGTGTNTYLQWSAVSGATGYLIVANDTTVIARLSSSTTSFTVTGSADYYGYSIIATFADGSLSQGVYWGTYQGPPGPASFYACFDATGTNILLDWTAVTSPATGYTIMLSEDQGYSWGTLANLSLSTTSFIDTNSTSDPDFWDAYTNGWVIYQIMADYPSGGESVAVSAMISNTPPATTNLAVAIDSTGTNALLSWIPSVMPVSNYTILRGTYNLNTGVTNFTAIATVSASTTNYTDHTAGSAANAKNNVYEIVANYSGWTTSGVDSSRVTSFPAPSSNTLSIAVQFVRNETGRWEFVFPYIPTNVATIAVYEYSYYYWDDYAGPLYYSDFPDYGNDPYYAAENDIPVSSISNGIYVIPDYILTNWFPVNSLGKNFMVQPVDTSGNYGTLVSAGLEPYDMPRFVDARVHMKQNLLFSLREATTVDPSVRAYEQNYWDDPFFENLGVPGDTNYVESSIFHSSLMNKGYGNFYVPYVQMDDVWPVTVNYEDFADLYDTNSAGIAFNWQSDPAYGYYSAPWYFVGTITTNPAPPVLNIGDPYWIQQSIPFGYTDTGSPDYSSAGTLGCTGSGYNLTLQSASRNVYGLTYATALVNPAHNGYDSSFNPISFPNVTLAPGSSINITNVDAFYSQTVDPELSLLDYYFAPVNTPGMNLPGDSTPTQIYQFPTIPGFANTNTTQLQITSVGTPTVFGGWARYTIANGYSSKRAYLGQYFQTNAFVISNSVFTTNTTGIVSPYGDFFPTAPGTVAMVTMPDIDTGVKGTNVVRVISLNADANHDGVMDFNYFGPDSVSSSHPFRFWVNDNQDNGDDGGEGIPGLLAPQADGFNSVSPIYVNGILGASVSSYGPPVYHVHGRRDLVDFFPVCVNISGVFQSNALSAGISPTDTNYQFLLSQADGILRFAYTGLTPTNYMNFLLDTNESGLLAYTNLTTITASGVVLSNTFLSGIAASNQCVILIEAASSTANPLVLTIMHGTNQIAQAQLALSISGVEQMFRNKNLLLTADSRSKPDRLTAADVPNEPDTTSENFIFIHGYNVNPDQARGWFADMYKRLYWSGSHAKFYGVTWTAFDSQIAGEVSINLQTNIVHAFNTAPLLNSFLNALTGTNVVAAHSLGNMLVLSTLNDYTNQNIYTFFMIDAAVAIEAVDNGASPNPDMCPSAWTNYESRLWASQWHNLFATNDGRSQLTWKGRLDSLQNSDIYDFYSSGEEVLRDYPSDPPTSYIGIAISQLVSIWQGNKGANAWAFQEKLKGLMPGNGFLSSDHGGWQFNQSYETMGSSGDPGIWYLMPPTNAAMLTDAQLETNAFFNFSSSSNGVTFTNDLGLETFGGSSYAKTNQNRILSDAIPCLTLPIGANPITDPGIVVQSTDMQLNYENGWPTARGTAQYPVGTTAAGEWHHSDVRAVAYTFTYKFFNEMVTVGNLK